MSVEGLKRWDRGAKQIDRELRTLLLTQKQQRTETADFVNLRSDDQLSAFAQLTILSDLMARIGEIDEPAHPTWTPEDTYDLFWRISDAEKPADEQLAQLPPPPPNYEYRARDDLQIQLFAVRILLGWTRGITTSTLWPGQQVPLEEEEAKLRFGRLSSTSGGRRDFVAPLFGYANGMSIKRESAAMNAMVAAILAAIRVEIAAGRLHEHLPTDEPLDAIPLVSEDLDSDPLNGRATPWIRKLRIWVGVAAASLLVIVVVLFLVLPKSNSNANETPLARSGAGTVGPSVSAEKKDVPSFQSFLNQDFWLPATATLPTDGSVDTYCDGNGGIATNAAAKQFQALLNSQGSRQYQTDEVLLQNNSSSTRLVTIDHVVAKGKTEPATPGFVFEYICPPGSGDQPDWIPLAVNLDQPGQEAIETKPEQPSNVFVYQLTRDKTVGLGLELQGDNDFVGTITARATLTGVSKTVTLPANNDGSGSQLHWHGMPSDKTLTVIFADDTRPGYAGKFQCRDALHDDNYYPCDAATIKQSLAALWGTAMTG